MEKKSSIAISSNIAMERCKYNLGMINFKKDNFFLFFFFNLGIIVAFKNYYFKIMTHFVEFEFERGLWFIICKMVLFFALDK
jgi:hypothetical protein